MDIFGIGIPEALILMIIMLVILGPTDMVKAGRTLGTNLRKLWTSPTWRMIFSTSNVLRNLPNALARETGVEELRQELRRETDVIKSMGKEITEAAQINSPKTAPLTHSAPVKEGETDEFSAWTTPIGPPSAAEMDNHSILPPHFGKQSSPEPEGDSASSSPKT